MSRMKHLRFIYHGLRAHPVLAALWLLVVGVFAVWALLACHDAGTVSVERHARITQMLTFDETREIRGVRAGSSGMPMRFRRWQVSCLVIPSDEYCFIDVGSDSEYARYREGQQVITAVVLAKPEGVIAWTREAALYAKWSGALLLCGLAVAWLRGLPDRRST